MNTSKLALFGGEPSFNVTLNSYPQPFGQESEELNKVLNSRQWNVGYGPGPTQELEQEFAAYIGRRYAVAVNTGGMALQMSLRALGIEPGDEVLFQVNTCSANANAVMNAQGTPIFADADPQSFMLDKTSLESWITPRTKIIIPVHMWGRPENLDMIKNVAKKHNLIILEDACLAIGAQWKGRQVGQFGQAACFSFGCLKALQAGEGGMIVTDDESLYKELCMLRPWGDMSEPYGVRDQRELAWNGRPSQFVTAVALAQLRKFPEHLERLNDGAERLREKLSGIPGIFNMIDDDRITKEAYTQFMFRIDEEKLGCSRAAFAAALTAEGIPFVWHGAFEPINQLTLWQGNRWRTWINQHEDVDFVARNYGHTFKHALKIHNHSGMSVGRDILTGTSEIQTLAANAIHKVCENTHQLKKWVNNNE